MEGKTERVDVSSDRSVKRMPSKCQLEVEMTRSWAGFSNNESVSNIIGSSPKKENIQADHVSRIKAGWIVGAMHGNRLGAGGWITRQSSPPVKSIEKRN